MRGVGVLTCLAVAAWGGTGPSRFELRAWGVAEGLPQTSVTDLCQDSRGFVWVATFGGLARFDGESFLRVDPPHGDLDGHRFVSVACDGARIWAGTDTGRLFHFDDFGRGAPVELELQLPLREPLWDLDVTPDGLRVAAGRSGAWAVRERATRLSEATTRVVAFAPDGATWAAGDRELRCLDGRCAGQRFALEGKVQSLGVRADGVVQVGTTVGIEVLRDGRVTLQTPGVGLFEADVSLARTWEVSATGLRVVTAAGVEEVPLAWGSPPLREPAVRELLVDVNGVLWVGTDDQGLLAVRDRGVQLLGEAHGLSHRSVLLVLPLREGGALISTYCHGLERLSADGARISRVPGIADDECIFAAAQSADGTVWLDRGGRFTRWGEAGPTTLFTLAAEATIKVIEVEGARAWLGTTAGLVELDLSTRPAAVVRTWTTADGLLDDKVLALSRGPDGALFIGTQRGAMRLRGARLERLVPPAKDRPAAVRDLLVEPGGVVWLATYGEGLARVGPDGEVRWLTREGGFCSDELSRVLPVGDALWFNTNQGAFRVRRASLEAHARGEGVPSCEPFLSGEGNGGAQRAGGLSNLGLLLPTVNGVARIDPGAPPPVTALPVFIDEASVDGLPLSLTDVTVVPPGRRDLILSLATPRVPRDALIIEQTLSSNGERRTRLGGRTATWLNLAPGTWVFEARRRGLDGTFGPPTTLRFTLAPTFLETPGARLGLPLAALALIALGVRVWTKTVRERAVALEAELEQRRRLEAAQHERDAVYRTVFTGSPLPLFLFDEHDVLEELNPAALASFPRAQVGSAGLEFIQPAERDAFREVLRRARAGVRDSREFTSLEGEAAQPMRRGEEVAGVHPAAPALTPHGAPTQPELAAPLGATALDATQLHEAPAAREADSNAALVEAAPPLPAGGALNAAPPGQPNSDAALVGAPLAAHGATEPNAARQANSHPAHAGATPPLRAPRDVNAAPPRQPNSAAPLAGAGLPERDASELNAARDADSDALAGAAPPVPTRSATLNAAREASSDAPLGARLPERDASELNAARQANCDAALAGAAPPPVRATTHTPEPDAPNTLPETARAAGEHTRVELNHTEPELPRPPALDRAAPLLVARAADGPAPRRRVLRVDAAPLVRGAQRSVLVAATDLTAVRDAEAERTALRARAANAQRLEGLGRLAAGIAHDFNNVLAALSLQIGDLQRTGGDARVTAEMLDAVEMGRNLTRRFLIFGRGDSELKAIALDDALGESRAVLGRLFPEGVRFEVSPGAPGAAAWLARAHLDQLLLNLVVNARDASRPGGRVAVRTRRASEPRDEGHQVLPRPAGEVVELIVEDDGAGMNEATLSRAFEPFFTTKSPTQGTGVGLTIVHSIALHAGAGLAVWSKAGVGTRFVLQLRAAPRVEPLRDEAPRPVTAAAQKPTVLICDDVAPLRSAVGRVFRRAGFLVLEAGDGEEALAQLARHPVSLLVTDLLMPKMDGVELITRLRAEGNELPIILLSGFPGDALARLDAARRRRLVALEKPFVPEVLVKTARDLLGPEKILGSRGAGAATVE